MENITLITLLLSCFPIIFGQLFYYNNRDYWKERATILKNENEQAFGGNFQLTKKERFASEILMNHKLKELKDGFADPKKFLPARSFLEARNDIDKSKVFEIIKKMPKGAVLHAHNTAIASDDWIYNNVTFRDNLYVCDKNDFLTLQFFKYPPNDCNWQLLSNLRKDQHQATVINARIRKQLTMATDNPTVAYPSITDAWIKLEEIFTFTDSMLSYRPVYADNFYQELTELYEDNILYLELRSSMPELYDLDGKKYHRLEVMKIYKEVSERFKANHPDFIGVKIIFSPNKIGITSDMQEMINLTIDIMNNYPDMFAGLDLVGQEDPSEPIKKYMPMFSHLINKVKFFFHAGETNWYGMSSDTNLIDAILLNTTRIGHGYAIVKHPKMMELARMKNIAIEVCPISNQVLGLVKDLRNHPANILFASNYPIVVSNDDPGLWGSKGLSYDFYEAFMGMMSKDSDIRALKQLALNSIKYSSMDSTQKGHAINIWVKKWHQFLYEIQNAEQRRLFEYKVDK